MNCSGYAALLDGGSLSQWRVRLTKAYYESRPQKKLRTLCNAVKSFMWIYL